MNLFPKKSRIFLVEILTINIKNAKQVGGVVEINTRKEPFPLICFSSNNFFSLISVKEVTQLIARRNIYFLKKLN
jgi:hypothetical protein